MSNLTSENTKVTKLNSNSATRSHLVPLLTLPGSLVSASSLLEEDNSIETDAGTYSTRSEIIEKVNSHQLPGILQSSMNENGEKKKSNRPRAPKATGGIKENLGDVSSGETTATNSNSSSYYGINNGNIRTNVSPRFNTLSSGNELKMPAINQSKVHYDQKYIVPDGLNQGDDWDLPSVRTSQGVQVRGISEEDTRRALELEYSDDEDFASHNNPSKENQKRGKKKKNRNARNSRDNENYSLNAGVQNMTTLPPIDFKNGTTPRVQSAFSLPPI
jgi:hypothetical protein